MGPKDVASHLLTQLTSSFICWLPPLDHVCGGSQMAAEGHWSTLALIVSIRILRERGKQVRFCKPQASKHKDEKLDLPIVEEVNRSWCPGADLCLRLRGCGQLASWQAQCAATQFSSIVQPMFGWFDTCQKRAVAQLVTRKYNVVPVCQHTNVTTLIV